jgi:hypothetical protein
MSARSNYSLRDIGIDILAVAQVARGWCAVVIQKEDLLIASDALALANTTCPLQRPAFRTNSAPKRRRDLYHAISQRKPHAGTFINDDPDLTWQSAGQGVEDLRDLVRGGPRTARGDLADQSWRS